MLQSQLQAFLCAALAVMVPLSAGHAQNPPAHDQNAPSQFDAQSHPQRPNETLSERLDRTDGVIRPPAHVDPEIHEKPPATGDRDIVIPAPGAPGSDPAVKPK